MDGIRRLGHRVPGLTGLVQAIRRARRPRTASLDWPDRDLRVAVTSDVIVRSRLHPVAKEPWTSAWLERSIRPDDVVWDIGANIGGYSLIAAAVGATVVAFEPAPSNYAALCENLALNGLEDRVTPVPLLLGSRTGIQALGLTDIAAGAATHTVGDLEPQSDSVSVVARIATLAATVDDAVSVYGLPAPDLVKLDVDGAEADVLAGGSAAFRRPKLRSMLVEVERRREDEVNALASAYGFELVERIDERDGVRLEHIWYGIFERP